MLMDRRAMLRGIGLLMAAPLIVRAASLMPVKAAELDIARLMWPGINPAHIDAAEDYELMSAMIGAPIRILMRVNGEWIRVTDTPSVGRE